MLNVTGIINNTEIAKYWLLIDQLNILPFIGNFESIVFENKSRLRYKIILIKLKLFLHRFFFTCPSFCSPSRRGSCSRPPGSPSVSRGSLSRSSPTEQHGCTLRGQAWLVRLRRKIPKKKYFLFQIFKRGSLQGALLYKGSQNLS